ncbi:twin-arginine translocase TatA/TatE family subunit [Aquipuribacter sp. MA13-6]|uniref:twin-arginine translocase TatA/TatE family subunit n=1 Tax=unclassified Aquipuribacter TaxID=2635084 RepID=UPI003EEFE51A
MLDINGGEFVVLALLAALLLGPDRLPELARGAARLIRRGRDFATGASAQMKDEMGVDLDGVDWRRYDPRQYHPRRIVQNALSDAFEEDDGPPRTGSSAAGSKAGAAASAAKRAEAARTAPAGTPTTRPGGTVRPGGTTRAAGAGPGSAARDSARGSNGGASVGPSPAPTSWAEAARRVGVDDDAT